MGSWIHDGFLDSRLANGCSTLRKAEDLMPRDIMSSEPRHWMVFGQLAMPVQCCAEAWRLSTALTGMANWPNTIQCLGSNDIMSLGIKSSAFLRVEHTFAPNLKLRYKVFEY